MRAGEARPGEYDLTLLTCTRRSPITSTTAYLDHRAEIDQRIVEDNALAEALRERTRSKLPR